MAYANSQALQARGLSLMDVVQALDTSNLILPAGDVEDRVKGLLHILQQHDRKGT